MPGSLVLPHTIKPHNLSLPADAKATPLDSDLYNICERIAEISPRLRVVLLEHAATDTYAYAIMEDCDDGECRLVFKCKELDGRVIAKLQRMMSIPFAQRFAEAEAECFKFEQEEHEKSMEELYEKIGGPMWAELEKCGFIDRPVSYAKRNRAARRARAR